MDILAVRWIGWKHDFQPTAVERSRWAKAELVGELVGVDWEASEWSSSLSHCTGHRDPSPPPVFGSTRLRTGPRGNLCSGSLAQVLLVGIEDSSQMVEAGKMGEIHLVENLPLGNLAVSKPHPASPHLAVSKPHLHQKLPLPGETPPPLFHILRFCNPALPSFDHCKHPW